MQTHSEIPKQQNNPNPSINISLGADTILLVGFIFWFFWNKFVRKSVVNKIIEIFSSNKENESRIEDILAQIGILTKASRVVLAVFHNGDINHFGYHYDKMSITNIYTSPHIKNDNYMIKNVPVSKISDELKMMKNTDDWVSLSYKDRRLSQSCVDYLMSKDIMKMCNRMIRMENIDIGILSIQYCKGHHDDCSQDDFNCSLNDGTSKYASWIEELYSDLCSILRSKIVDINPVAKAFKNVF